MDLFKGKKSLLDSFLKTGNTKSVIKSLEYIINNSSPFALYIATLDHHNCSWIFDPETIKNMLKTFNTTIEDINQKIFNQTGMNLEDQECILFFVFTKIDPLIFAPIPKIIIEEVLEELYNQP